eukprot:4507377-Alexandrium_andersonii.AAC.1
MPARRRPSAGVLRFGRVGKGRPAVRAQARVSVAARAAGTNAGAQSGRVRRRSGAARSEGARARSGANRERRAR